MKLYTVLYILFISSILTENTPKNIIDDLLNQE